MGRALANLMHDGAIVRCLTRNRPHHLRIVLTQAHYSPQARTYIDRRVSEGKSRREAHRALRRFVARAVWRLWQECQPAEATNAVQEAA